MPIRFSKVSNELYRGGEPSFNDLKLLKKFFNIKLIISLDLDIGKKISTHCKSLDLKQMIIPIGGIETSSNIDFVKNNINKIVKPNSYVHCRHGKDRTGMFCAIYRIFNGMSTDEAIEEALSFDMGLGLNPEATDLYFGIIETFEPDKNDSNIPSFAPFSPDVDSSSPVLNINASKRIYTKTNNVLNKNNVWTRHPLKKGGNKLFSAEISSDANIKEFKRKFNRKDLSLAKDFDIVTFVDYIFVLNPNYIINIKEENIDESDVNSASILSGQMSNYDGLAQFSSPGSGGILENSGGFGGFVQLPHSQY